MNSVIKFKYRREMGRLTPYWRDTQREDGSGSSGPVGVVGHIVMPQSAGSLETVRISANHPAGGVFFEDRRGEPLTPTARRIVESLGIRGSLSIAFDRSLRAFADELDYFTTPF